MSPLKYQDDDLTRGVINGPRPLPLRISKDSHVIHKPPPPPSAAAARQTAAAAKRQPVIIYTHSPKVIHTQPNDFMTLVQKLTGMSRDDDAVSAAVPASEEAARVEEDSAGAGIVINNVGSFDESNETTTSVLTDDHGTAAAVSQMYKIPGAFLVEAPLFTPSSSEFFCSPRPGSMFHQSPAMAAAAISPSFMDYMKAFPDY